MVPAPLLDRFSREAAQGLVGLDVPVYEEAGRPAWEPVLLGSGDLSAPLGFFGRDPGRTEVLLGEPFVGRGGQLVRAALHRAARGTAPPDAAAALAIGRRVFWANTVPYKPTGNKPWSTAVKRRFAPLIAELLVEHWRGHTLICLGNDAFEWFGLADPTLRPALERYWEREDRYEAHIDVALRGKLFTLRPLPHPSPLNATWFSRFPAMLDRRLQELGWGREP